MSNRPGKLKTYSDMDLKLGIKSSLPNPKSTLALAILFWRCSNRPASIEYSKEEDSGIVISDSLREKLILNTKMIISKENIKDDSFIFKINQNQLFKSQLEALIVGFELIWRIAKVKFTDSNLNASAERTGGNRYKKILEYTINIDIIDSLIANDEEGYYRCLLAWIGFNIPFDKKLERNLLEVLQVFSETSIFKLKDGNNDIIFNQNSIYLKSESTNQPVDINGDEEAKGPLRILKSSLSDGMNPYLTYSSNCASVRNGCSDDLRKYQKRVDTFLSLNANKLIKIEPEPIPTASSEVAEKSDEINIELNRVLGGQNILLYGVPGSGKSWTIEHEYCKNGEKVERLVFHPDYTNSDFVGQILPVVSEDKLVTYEFVPGPFTNILKAAYEDPEHSYVLIIEEVNRGNAPAIFGDVFQLLDRTVEKKTVDGETYQIGTSEYGITNSNIAYIVYGDSRHKVRIPSNLSILGTMNTSDQNVFPLDTAFQRRWHMRLIENSFDKVRNSLKTAKILDTGVTWQKFCETINKIIISNKAKMVSAEDKRLGVYFIHENDLVYDANAVAGDGFDSLLAEYNDLVSKETAKQLNDNQKQRLTIIRNALLTNRVFPEKVIKYLWDDAFKFNLEALFDIEHMDSLETVVKTFIFAKGKERFRIFKPSVFESLCPSEI